MKSDHCFANCCIDHRRREDIREDLSPDGAGDKSFCKSYMWQQKFIQFLLKSSKAFVVKTLE